MNEEKIEKAIELLKGAQEALSWWETTDEEALSRENMAVSYISRALKILDGYKGGMKDE